MDKMNETHGADFYDFKENDEAAQAYDDMDDFERRLAGGAPAASKPAAPRAVSSARPHIHHHPPLAAVIAQV